MITVSSIPNHIFNSRTHILEDADAPAVWLVDCGDIEKVWERIGPRPVAGLLLTHAHFDHIYGIPALLERFPACRVVTNEAGKVALGNAKANLSRYQDAWIEVAPEGLLVVREGDSVALFDGVEAAVYETPGHHPSCLTFAADEYLFTGDAYIPGEKVITNLPGGNKLLAAESVERILALSQNKTICPGHGERL